MSILRLMNTPESIIDDTASYIGIMYVGLTATVAYNVLPGILRSLGDSKTPLLFLVFSSILNIVRDLLLIRIFHMGVAGAAWATVISQMASQIMTALGVGMATYVGQNWGAGNIERVRQGVRAGCVLVVCAGLTAI